MPRIAYTTKNFRPATLAVIEKANEICAEYARQGFDLTLRQLYYQFVARDLIPNRANEYDKLGSIINDARLAGLLDWSYINDRTRNLRGRSHWESADEIVRGAAQSYHRDLWEDQGTRVEVWIEKDALVGVISGACEALDVDYFSCRGYVSQSEMWAAARRHARYLNADQDVVVLHLGDHDPSGIDMTRDIADRLAMFTGYNARLSVERIALTMDQVNEHNPPPNPAKLTDSRIEGYIALYGYESWELDALDPATLVGLINEHVGNYTDEGTMQDAIDRTEHERELLTAASDRWAEVCDFLTESA